MKLAEIKLDKKILEHRIKLIELHVQRLRGLKNLSPGRFALPDSFDIAAWNLRCALEAIFDVCNHIVSRIPGVKAGEYKQIATEMGKQGIVPKEFAEEKLEKMAGYRNRLTHFYFEVSPKEMYDIVQKDLGDFDIFLENVKKFIE